MRLLLASRPVSIRVPPNGQWAPAGSLAVRTSELVPLPLQRYEVPVAVTSSRSSAPLPLLSTPTTIFVPP
jgi:hypothetical protein